MSDIGIWVGDEETIKRIENYKEMSEEEKGAIEDLQNQIAELRDKLETKDKVIDKMAEDLTTPIHDKEWIINHYFKEIEKDEN